MDPSDSYSDLTQEMDALKHRVRHLIDTSHWLTDGEWKESVLRTILRRHLPATVGIGRGFIVTPDRASSQIDVLSYDSSYPLLHQDGDLVFIVPDAVRGIIEVKTTLTKAQARNALDSLARNASLIRGGATSIFLGLFAYDGRLGKKNGTEWLFAQLQETAKGDRVRAVNHVCIGTSSFVRFWTDDPFTDERMDVWREYPMADMARGYFVFNALEAGVGRQVRDNLWAWFPRRGKDYQKQAPLVPYP